MTRKAIERSDVLKRLLRNEIKQVDAARLLGVTSRQVRNLASRYNKEGDIGLVSRAIGSKPCN